MHFSNNPQIRQPFTLRIRDIFFAPAATALAAQLNLSDASLTASYCAPALPLPLSHRLVSISLDSLSATIEIHIVKANASEKKFIYISRQRGTGGAVAALRGVMAGWADDINSRALITVQFQFRASRPQSKTNEIAEEDEAEGSEKKMKRARTWPEMNKLFFKIKYLKWQS